jgi:hypothetical protein
LRGLFDEILELPKRFRLNDIQAWRPAEERTLFEDPMRGLCLDLQRNVHEGTVTGERERSALHWARIADHYFEYVILLLAFVLGDLQEYRRGNKREWPDCLRLPLDLDKLLSDIRAMLDALYCLSLLYQPDAGRIPSSRQHSFGQFSDWYEAKSPGAFPPPLGLLVEAMPWAQDIRTLRDGYVHRGHESLVFYGDTELYLDPSAHRSPPKARVLPDLFYDPSNPNNLIIIEKFLVFIVAPVLALRRMLGDTLQVALQPLPGWRRLGIGMPFKQGPGICRMLEWLQRNTDVLDPVVFKERHFA